MAVLWKTKQALRNCVAKGSLAHKASLLTETGLLVGAEAIPWYAGNYYAASFISDKPDNFLKSKLWTRNNVNLKDKGNITTPALKWKRDLGHPYGYGTGQPIIADIDKDGEIEIVTTVPGTTVGNDYVFCFKGEDGTVKWQSSKIRSVRRVTAYDINQDGYVEILASVGSGTKLGLHCLDHEGSEKWLFNETGVAYVACYDIDGDGNIELIVAGVNGKLYCLDYNGNVKWSLQLSTTYPLYQVAIGDVNNDGEPEIIVNTVGDFDETGSMYCVDRNRNILWSEDFSAAPLGLALADVNNDGKLEIIFSLYFGDPSAKTIVCLDSEGNELWTYTTEGWLHNGQVAVYDINGDGYPEICVGDSGANKLLCLDHEGNKLWEYPTDLYVESGVCIADVSGDGNFEVLFSSRDGKLRCLKADGTLLWEYSSPGITRFNVAVADVDNDGIAEIVYQSGDAVGNYYRLICLEGAT